MQLPDGKLTTIQARLSPLLASRVATPTALQPELPQAFDRLLEVMTRLETDAGRTDVPGADVTEIGEYALRLCAALAAELERTRAGEVRTQMAELVANVAVWIARHGGLIDSLEPVVDALALLANAQREPAALAALSAMIGRIVAAVSPRYSQDLEKTNPGRPWRVLLINHSIVATRSHDIDLMEAAFALLTRHLPEDAGRFFSEGMQQMAALDYPEPVRRLMARYHRQWTQDRSLH